MGGEHPKLHWILGEHFESIERPEDARRAFAESHKATPQRPQYARKFADDAAEKHAAGDLRGAAEDLGMATLVEPDGAGDVSSWTWASCSGSTGLVWWAEGLLRAAAPSAARPRRPVALACLSLVLADAGDARRRDGAAERDDAMAAGADDAAAA